jgi:Pregnancy-associated plasma protein-A/Secretion system C-terminal sorting domain
MKLKLKLLFCLLAIQFSFSQQRTCGVKEQMERIMSNPKSKKIYLEQQQKFQLELEKLTNLEQQKSALSPATTIRIPVAVHYPSGSSALPGVKTCLRNFAQQQVNILNADYNALNTDISNWAAASGFYPGTNIGNMDVEFVIATQNHPAGTGLVNGDVAVTFGTDFLFGADEDLTWSGYMNLVVRNISGGILGYSPLGGLPNQGYTVVIDNNAFGSGSGCAGFVPSAPYNLGRTLTHELGHFFNLDHTFEVCDSGSCSTSGDLICDTPPANQPYFNCVAPGTVSSGCGSVPQLTMNYMDYVEDSCMYMFTAGQASRMQAWYNTIQSQFQTNVLANNDFNAISFSIYPNPSQGILNIKVDGLLSDFSVDVYDYLGRPVPFTQNSLSNTIELNVVSKGVYFVSVKTENNQVTKKIMIE